MNNPQIYQSDQFGSVRILYEDGKPLFCATDVAKALGYSRPKDAVTAHCHGAVKRRLIDSMGRNQQANFLPEGDVYRLITHSKLPSAEQFEHWVFDEVLPSIRQTGGYQSADVKQRIEQLEADNTRMSAAIATVNDARKNLSIARKNHDYYGAAQRDQEPPERGPRSARQELRQRAQGGPGRARLAELPGCPDRPSADRGFRPPRI